MTAEVRQEDNHDSEDTGESQGLPDGGPIFTFADHHNPNRCYLWGCCETGTNPTTPMGTVCCQSFNLCDEGRCGLEMPDEHLQRA